MKKVSVIIPYFKKKNYIKQTLISVLNQSYKNFEVILIYDDEDKSDLKYLKNLFNKSKKIKFLINKKNKGAGLSRNNGIKISKGYYLAFIDADDLWKKNKLKYQINFMEKNNIKFTHTSYKIINTENNIIKNMKATKELSYNDLMKSCDIGLSTVIIKKTLVKKFKFNHFKTKEDYSLWLKIAKAKYEIIGISKYLTYWRKSSNSLSSSLLRRIIDAFKVYFIEEKKGLLESIFAVLILSFNAIKKKI